MEGYAAQKMMKAGFRSNAIDPNARHCMASAVVGFYQTFGIDEPSGCYDDIELTDTVVTWGSNMAEMHPILWSRVTDRKLSDPDHVKIVNIQTYTHRTCDLGDFNIIFRPNTDLALWNYLAREIVYNHPEAIDWDFIKKNIIFAAGPVNMGYGMRRAGDKSLKEGKYTAKEMSKKVSAKEAPALVPYGYKEENKMNVSSIVVQALPEYIDELVAFFKTAEYVDYHLHDKEKGKIIVTVEGEGVEEEIKKLVKIQQLPHVIAADMMMTYQEDELDAEVKKLEAQNPVPDVLNEEDIDVRGVVYHGDLKNKDLGF